MSKVFSGIGKLPGGDADNSVTEGCIVLEGGAFRGIYTSGVLDALMEENINMRCTVGVSAGALNGINYVAGQIGRSARINLRYRHDNRYVGVRAFSQNRGIIGFDFIFGPDNMKHVPKLNMKRFMNPDRQFYAVVTNLYSGKTEYISKNSGIDIFQAVRASASMPYISMPIMLGGYPYLDGGCSCKIPYPWALEQNFGKIIVVKTRSKSYRKKTEPHKNINVDNIMYHSYPNFVKSLNRSNEYYNFLCDDLERLSDDGRVFVISPSEQIEINRLEGDMEKLGKFYYLGYNDTKKCMKKLKDYLNN